jgi:hypothetical protein
MIRRKTYSLFILAMFITQFAFGSCSNLVTEDAQPNIGIDDTHMNQQVIVHAPERINSFQTYDGIVLEILSLSNNEIRFSKNYSLKIFKKTALGWVEIKEKPIIRLPDQDVIFSPNLSAVEDLAVFPDLKDRSQSCQLRIYVIGDMKTEQGTEKVAAYIDIELQP